MRSTILQSEPRDRARSAAAAAAIHVLFGAAFLTGLALEPQRGVEDGIKTFDVRQMPPPPPPPVIEAASQPPALRRAPAGEKAEPSPIVAPPARIPTLQPVAAAPVAGTGSSSDAGAAASGSGTGAGGSGIGLGSGGNGAGRTGARLVSGGLGRHDYRQIAALGSPRGNAELLLLVNPGGRVERCRALRSSGNPTVDNALCQILLARARFSPAREADGSPLYQDVNYVSVWRR